MTRPWVVLKFGGSSVAEARHWQMIANIVRLRLASGKRPLLVISALRQVSNLLEALLHQAVSGAHRQALNHLRELHYGFSTQIGLCGEQLLAVWFSDLENLCQEIHRQGSIEPRIHARVLALGELLSSTLGAAYLREQGIASRWKDARRLLHSAGQTDKWHHYLSAECDYGPDENMAATLARDERVIVTQGFIAGDENGDTVLLGREGSDTSASYFGVKLEAEIIEIWTDVAGVFSANPQEIPQARQLPELTYDEARRMAQYGAKVLHYRAVQPAADLSIPIVVKATSKPAVGGTRIHAQAKASAGVRALVTESDLTYVGISGYAAGAEASIVAKFMALGFDLIMNGQGHSAIELYVRFANSDRVPPDANELMTQFKDYQLELDMGVGLVSLIGQPGGRWISEIDALCAQAEGLHLLRRCDVAQGGRVSLQVPQTQLAQWREFLHRHLFETNATTSLGKSWQSLHDG